MFTSFVKNDGILNVLDFDSLSFKPQRLFFVSQRPNTIRGKHFHDKDELSLLFLISGKVQIDTHFPDSPNERTIRQLNDPGDFCEIGGELCRSIRTFNNQATWMVLCNKPYDHKRVYDCGMCNG